MIIFISAEQDMEDFTLKLVSNLGWKDISIYFTNKDQISILLEI